MQEISILGAHPFLRGLPVNQVAAIASFARHVTVPARTRLFEEGVTANRFWLIDAGQAAVDVMVPGRGRLIIELLGRGDVLGLSWLLSAEQWRFGAVTTQTMKAFEFDGRAVRGACDEDPVLGYELTLRYIKVMVRRLQATRARLLDVGAHPDRLAGLLRSRD